MEARGAQWVGMPRYMQQDRAGSADKLWCECESAHTPLPCAVTHAPTEVGLPPRMRTGYGGKRVARGAARRIWRSHETL